MKRIAINTGGGDAPGLNAVIRSVALSALNRGWEVLGIRRGYEGLLSDGPDGLIALDRAAVRGIAHLGGTILGTTNRGDPFRYPVEKDGQKIPTDVSPRVVERFKELGVDALVALGGDGSMTIARRLLERGLPRVIGVPKTIDNDLRGTNVTFGFATAVETTTEALDRLHSTAQAHRRVMVVEVMGRHTGWIAAYGGIAGGADVVLVPEHPFRITRVCELLAQRVKHGRNFSIVVVAEDAHPHPDESWLSEEQCDVIYRHHRLGGIGEALAAEIERCTGLQTRVTKLGYVQRGGSPTAFDRILATRFGIKAYEMVKAGQWGEMAAIRGNRIVSVPLTEAVGSLKRLDEEIYRVAEVFFG